MGCGLNNQEQLGKASYLKVSDAFEELSIVN